MSLPGVSITLRPGVRIGSAWSTTPCSGPLPPFLAARSDFSSIVVSPPAMLPGTGWPPRRSIPGAFASCSKRSIVASRSAATCGVTARAASRCSAPISSEVSARIDVPPAATSRSLATPRAGLAVIPERVGAAALEAEAERGERRRLAPRPGPLLDESAGGDGCRGRRGGRAAARRQRDEAGLAAAGGAGGGDQLVLVVESDQHRAGDVRVGGEAGEQAPGPQHVVGVALADPVVRERDRAGHHRARLRRRRACRHVQRQHEHVVAEAPAPVRALVAEQLSHHI
jgi:hypothetical protein